MSEHFADLRLNTRGGGNDEGFWPSFTDIMTVVVMIFLLAMLILLLRNMDLVHRLQATLEAERAATEQVQTTTSRNRDLHKQLERTQAQLDMLRMQLMDMSEERDRLAGRLQRADAALNENKALLAQEKSARAALQAQLDDATARISALNLENRQKTGEISELSEKLKRSAGKLAALQGDFASLKIKYDKLVRPARTARGKYVVKVRILRRNNALQRFVQLPKQPFRAVGADAMRQMLDAAHAQHPDDMYVRIIFPDDSGLSYSEAWKITESLLRKYDYYYRPANRAPAR